MYDKKPQTPTGFRTISSRGATISTARYRSLKFKANLAFWIEFDYFENITKIEADAKHSLFYMGILRPHCPLRLLAK